MTDMQLKYFYMHLRSPFLECIQGVNPVYISCDQIGDGSTYLRGLYLYTLTRLW